MPSEKQEVRTPAQQSKGVLDTFWEVPARELLSLGIEEATLLRREREGEGDSARGTKEP
jgi:hypothetical protein